MNRDDLYARLAECDVPPHLRPGLERYFFDRILPGSFLQAVLANHLPLARLRGDAESLRALPALQTFLTHMPPACWGSREALIDWTNTPQRLEI